MPPWWPSAVAMLPVAHLWWVVSWVLPRRFYDADSFAERPL